MIGSRGAPASIGLYLVPQFSMIAFSSLLEVLRMANQLSAQTLYQWTLASSDGNPVTSSNGLSLGVEHSASARQRYDAVFVCGGLNIHKLQDDAGIQWLRQLDKQGATLGAICTGTYLLARAELLNEYRSTIHWENLAAAREEFPHLVLSPELYEIDRKR